MWARRGASLHEQRAARSVFSAAKKKGLVQPQPCEICGGRGEAHHDDYARPLDVRWLCHLHHMWLHHYGSPTAWAEGDAA